MEGRYYPTSNGMWENGLVPLSHLMVVWEGIFCIPLLIGENSPSMEYTPMHFHIKFFLGELSIVHVAYMHSKEVFLKCGPHFWRIVTKVTLISGPN